MTASIYWLFAFVLAYWAYCIAWGVKGVPRGKDRIGLLHCRSTDQHLGLRPGGHGHIL